MPPGEHCAHGGRAVETGVDTHANGTLSIIGNPKLDSLRACEPLESVTSMQVTENPALTTRRRCARPPSPSR